MVLNSIQLYSWEKCDISVLQEILSSHVFFSWSKEEIWPSQVFQEMHILKNSHLE